MTSVRLTVNGAEREVPDGTTLAELVEELSAGAPRRVAVAIDGEVVPRSSWDRPLVTGEHVEVVTAIQGGAHG